MTSEGGGKLRQKKGRVGAKPYDRPQSLIGRLKDTVVGILNPSWVSSFVPWSEPTVAADKPQSNAAEETDDHRESASRKSCLNSSATVSANNNISLTNLNTTRTTNRKAKIPLDNSAYFRTNHDRETLELETPHHLVSGPSTSTPLAASTSSSYCQALANAREFAAARRRKNIGAGAATSSPAASAQVLSAENRNEDPQQHPMPVPVGGLEAAKRVPPANVANNKMFAKLSDFSKLSEVSAINNKRFNTNCDSNSECSEESLSTSGCSSMVPHPDKKEYQREVIQLGKSRLNAIDEQLTDDVTSPASFSDSKTWGFSSELSERRQKSMFWPDNGNSDRRSISKPQPTATGSRPQFNSSLLGTSLWSESRSLLGKTAGTAPKAESPYLGKVTYGFGPPSAKRARSCASTPYSLDSLSRSGVTATEVKKNGDEYVMSSTAKRILLALEKMSTPVTDAKKIPTNSVLSPVLESPLTFNANARRRPNLSNSKFYSKGSMPPTQRLLTPHAVTTRTISHARQDNSNFIKNPLSNSEPTTASTSGTYFPSKPDSRGGGKIRARPEPMHYSSAAASKDELFEMPKLPAVSLSIQNLPVFDLIPSKPKAAEPKVVGPSINVTPKTCYKESNAPSVAAPTFTFSTPVVKQDVGSVNGNSISPALTPSLPSFQFHSPANEVAKSKVDSFQGFVSSTSPVNAKSLKRKSLHEVETPERATPVAVASGLKMGSVMDILGKSSSITTEKPVIAGFGDKFRPAEGSWSCPDCLITNKSGITKCVACGANKPGAAPKIAPTPAAVPAVSSAPATFQWGDKFRPAAGTWECPGCMLRVAATSDKCAACETPKPKAVGGTTTATTLTATGGLGANTTAQSSKLNPSLVDDGKWECDICLVKNESSANKCVACETLKRKPTQLAVSSGFKFNVPSTGKIPSSSSSFKFGLSGSSAVLSSEVTGNGFKFGFSSPSDTATVTVTTAATPATFSFPKPKDSTSVDENPVVTSSTMVSAAATSNVATTTSLTTAPSSTVSGGFKFGFQSTNNLVTSSTAVTPSTSLASAVLVPPPTSTLAAEQSESKPTSTTTTVSSSTLSSFVTNTVPFGSVVSSTTTLSAPLVQTTKSEVFSFGAKSSSLAPTTSTTTVTTSVAPSVPSTAAGGGFSFSFATPSGPKTSSNFAFTPTTVASTVASESALKLPQATFGTGISGLAATTSTPASTSGTFSFSFGANASGTGGGVKRSSSGNDEADGSKKATFGSITSSEKPNFSFKAPAPVFGALSTVSDKSPASSTFTFGNSASTPSITPVSYNSLKVIKPAFGSSSAPNLAFGSSVSTPSQTSIAAPVFGSSSNNQPFVFGATNAATSSSSSTTFGAAGVSAASTFGNGGFGGLAGSTTQPASSGFNFGATSSTSLTTTTAPASSTFTFGAQPAAQPGVFSFSGNQQQQQPPTSSFGGFGGSQQPNTTQQQQPAPGFNFNPAQPPSFNFGASNNANPMQNPAFQFSANPFDAHTVGQANRLVRKARRRNK